jgi:hypothetical protein
MLAIFRMEKSPTETLVIRVPVGFKSRIRVVVDNPESFFTSEAEFCRAAINEHLKTHEGAE